jgi:hypothetical protein
MLSRFHSSRERTAHECLDESCRFRTCIRNGRNRCHLSDGANQLGTHPRRDQVNDRLQNQNRRINQEVREGEISKAKASQLHREDHAIRREERTMSKFNNGHITPAEQKSLNQQENAVSGQIGR